MVAEMPRNAFEAEAVALMREALKLLDTGGGSDAAAALQQALDIAEGRPAMSEGDPVDAELVNRILGPLDLAPRGHHMDRRSVRHRRASDAVPAEPQDRTHH